MLLKVFNDKVALGNAAAEQAASAIRRAIAQHGRARIIAATAASQLEFLDALTTIRTSHGGRVSAANLKLECAREIITNAKRFLRDLWVTEVWN